MRAAVGALVAIGGVALVAGWWTAGADEHQPSAEPDHGQAAAVDRESRRGRPASDEARPVELGSPTKEVEIPRTANRETASGPVPGPVRFSPSLVEMQSQYERRQAGARDADLESEYDHRISPLMAHGVRISAASCRQGLCRFEAELVEYKDDPKRFVRSFFSRMREFKGFWSQSEGDPPRFVFFVAPTEESEG